MDRVGVRRTCDRGPVPDDVLHRGVGRDLPCTSTGRFGIPPSPSDANGCRASRVQSTKPDGDGSPLATPSRNGSAGSARAARAPCSGPDSPVSVVAPRTRPADSTERRERSMCSQTRSSEDRDVVAALAQLGEHQVAVLLTAHLDLQRDLDLVEARRLRGPLVHDVEDVRLAGG